MLKRLYLQPLVDRLRQVRQKVPTRYVSMAEGLRFSSVRRLSMGDVPLSGSLGSAGRGMRSVIKRVAVANQFGGSASSSPARDDTAAAEDSSGRVRGFTTAKVVPMQPPAEEPPPGCEGSPAAMEATNVDRPAAEL